MSVTGIVSVIESAGREEKIDNNGRAFQFTIGLRLPHSNESGLFGGSTGWPGSFDGELG